MPTKPPSAKKTKQLLVWMDPEQYTQVKDMAYEDRISAAELMRRLFEREFSRRERAVARASGQD